MRTAYSVVVPLFLATLVAAPTYGQVQGNLTAQEKADVPFRPITIVGIPFDSHGGIYVDYEDEDLTRVANTKDMTAHTLIEMTGITGVASTSGGSVVRRTAGINQVSLADLRSRYF